MSGATKKDFSDAGLRRRTLNVSDETWHALIDSANLSWPGEMPTLYRIAQGQEANPSAEFEDRIRFLPFFDDQNQIPDGLKRLLSEHYSLEHDRFLVRRAKPVEVESPPKKEEKSEERTTSSGLCGVSGPTTSLGLCGVSGPTSSGLCGVSGPTSPCLCGVSGPTTFIGRTTPIGPCGVGESAKPTNPCGASNRSVTPVDIPTPTSGGTASPHTTPQGVDTGDPIAPPALRQNNDKSRPTLQQTVAKGESESKAIAPQKKIDVRPPFSSDYISVCHTIVLGPTADVKFAYVNRVTDGWVVRIHLVGESEPINYYTADVAHAAVMLKELAEGLCQRNESMERRRKSESCMA